MLALDEQAKGNREPGKEEENRARAKGHEAEGPVVGEQTFRGGCKLGDLESYFQLVYSLADYVNVKLNYLFMIRRISCIL